MPDSFITLPTEAHTHTIIFLHGRDSTASEFAPEFFESQGTDDLTLPESFPNIKWVFPTSKLRTSQRFETEMSQWFDIWSVENPAEKEEIQIKGLKESVAEILAIIQVETSFVPIERIILGGISQGCATAILILLQGRIKLGGFIGLCSWLPFQRKLLQGLETPLGNNIDKDFLSLSTTTRAIDTPIFLSHCKDDDMVPIGNGRKLYETAKHVGMNVKWKEYEDGGHWINEPGGVDDIACFLKGVIKTC